MNRREKVLGWFGLSAGAMTLLLAGGRAAPAHCDTMDGPVVVDAQAALEKGDAAGVLKWVPKESEQEVRRAFQRTLAVRAKGPEAKELADLYFFETLVRLHRAGEGEPYTGLKPAGSAVSPAVAKADQALAKGDVGELAEEIALAVEAGIRQRFAAAVEADKHKAHDVEAGRKYVPAYVQFVHFVEGIHGMLGGAGHLHAAPQKAHGAAGAERAHEPAKTPAEAGHHQ